jgi:hypothetical protein
MRVRAIIAVFCLSAAFAAAAAPVLGCDGQKKTDTQADSKQASADAKGSK